MKLTKVIVSLLDLLQKDGLTVTVLSVGSPSSHLLGNYMGLMMKDQAPQPISVAFNDLRSKIEYALQGDF